jgi:hypothetical protein
MALQIVLPRSLDLANLAAQSTVAQSTIIQSSLWDSCYFVFDLWLFDDLCAQVNVRLHQ